ncbi:MAG: oleandomycin glycosyltransferase [Candidatus Xenobia bacterium]
MATLLFATQPGSGHFNPLLSIARRMEAQGHHTAFTCSGPPDFHEEVRRARVELHPLPQPLSLSVPAALLLPHTRGMLETMVAVLVFTGDLVVHARALATLLADRRPDAVICDFAFPAAALAAERAGLPWVSVYHAGLAYRGPSVPPLGSGLPIGGQWGWRGQIAGWMERLGNDLLNRRMARARARLGLPAVKRDYFWTSPWLTLVLSAEAVEAPRHSLTAETCFIGPCFGERSGEQFGLERRFCERPLVYVSLGTVFNRKPDVFHRILTGLQEDCELVVSAGGAFPALSARRYLPSVHLFPRVPQVDLLPLVDAVVSHGGNNTINETLAAGKPLLVLPVGGEQQDNASRVEFLGAGLRTTLNAPAATIRALVGRLIRESSFRDSASACAAVLAETRGTETARLLIERLLETGRPVSRVAGFPQTITARTGLPWEV